MEYPFVEVHPGSLGAAVEASARLAPQGEAVVFARHDFSIVDPDDVELGPLPWPFKSTDRLRSLLDLVDDSSEDDISAAMSRAAVLQVTRTTALMANGTISLVTLLCFGESDQAVAVFDPDAIVAKSMVHQRPDFRTRITCARDGEFLDADGSIGSYGGLDDLGRWAERVVAPESRDALRAAVDRVLSGEPYAQAQLAGAAPGLYFEAVVAPLSSHIVIDLYDDSHNRAAYAALTRSQTQFNQLSETLPVGVFVVGPAGTMDFHSERLREMLGPQISSIWDWVELVHESDRPILETAVAALPETRGFSVELRGYRADGTTGWFRVAGSDMRDQDGLLKCVVGFVEDISEHRDLHKKVEFQARFDGLTDLPNRMTLVEELRARLARESDGSTAVLFIDLDEFKLINDTQGHSVGDAVLIEVAQRFRRAIRPTDLIGRFGGDEFVVVASDISQAGEAESIARRLHDVLSTPVLADGRIINVNASIGIVLSEYDSLTPDQLISDADIAMYEAKAAGKDRSVLFDAPLRARASQRFDMTADLRHARRRRELRLEYQPIIKLDGESMVGVEALVRWEHPTLGWISPGVFIPLAEEIGLVSDVGEWVLEQACADLDRLRAQQLIDSDFAVSINASAQQFDDVGVLATNALAALNQYGLAPHNVRFELTESVPLTQIPEAASRIRKLTSYGFGLAIDDFGTGYSSLGYLTMLPFDVLKLDLSLIAQLEAGSPALAVVDSLTSMSHDIGFDIVAEGIETAKQQTLLHQAGVPLGQGYHISRPLPLAQLTDILEAAKHGRKRPADDLI